MLRIGARYVCVIILCLLVVVCVTYTTSSNKMISKKRLSEIYEKAKGVTNLSTEKRITRVLSEDWAKLVLFVDYTCPSCHKKRKLVADHVIPRSKGGLDVIENIQPLCLRCNSKKATRETRFIPKWGHIKSA